MSRPREVPTVAATNPHALKMPETSPGKAPPERPVALIGLFPPPWGGQAVYNLGLAEQLNGRGIAVTRIDVSPPLPATSISRVSRRSLMTILLSGKFALFHLTVSDSRWIGFELIAAAASLVRRVPFVYNILAGRFGERTASYSPLHRLLLCLALRRARCILVSNECMAAQVRRLPLLAHRNVQVVGCRLPLGIIPSDDPALLDHLDSGTPSIVTVGAMRHAYGLDLLVRACDVLHVRGFRPRLLIILSGDEEQPARAAFDQALGGYAARADIRVIRDLPRAKVLGAIRSADVVARPSRADGDSLTIHEAQALGTPVVASDAAPRPRGVVLHVSEDPASLADALEAASTAPRPATKEDDAMLVERVCACYRAAGVVADHA